MIADFARHSPVPLRHSWQEDRGFRLSASRNKALAKASGDYIILMDGDILLEKNFIFDHKKFARPGYFIQGTRVLINERLSREILHEQKLMGAFCARGVENKKNCIRSRLLANMLSFTSKKSHGVRTCNFAFWRRDAIAVNGFNEEFVGWGREDSEFTARLINSGLIRRNIRFNALAYHLYHPMNDRNHVKMNDRILENTIREKMCWCELGIDQYLV
jgi:glycosyltransferase involved in cell wall biosynthesis